RLVRGRRVQRRRHHDELSGGGGGGPRLRRRRQAQSERLPGAHSRPSGLPAGAGAGRDLHLRV
ncbi:hypothetical protein LTR94_038651, partial [Friedmanniomyces endolithicus]